MTTNRIAVFRALRSRGLSLRGAWRTMRRGDDAVTLLTFSVEEKGDGWLLVTCQQTDPSIPLNPADLGDVAPPAVPMGAKVILSGRMPNWLAASLAMAFHGIARAVALFQPGVGATIAWTHSKECALGEAIPV